MPAKKPKYAPKGLYYRKERERFVYRWRDHRSGKYRRFSLDVEVQSWPEACKIIKTHKERIRTEKLARLDPSLITLGAFKEAYTQHRARLPLAEDTKRRDGQALDSLISALGEGCLLRTINQSGGSQILDRHVSLIWPKSTGGNRWPNARPTAPNSSPK